MHEPILTYSSLVPSALHINSMREYLMNLMTVMILMHMLFSINALFITTSGLKTCTTIYRIKYNANIITAILTF